MNHRLKNKPNIKFGFILLVIVLILGVTLISANNTFTNRKTANVKVLDKDRVCSKDADDCQYLIFTDRGTFKVIDSMFATGRRIDHKEFSPHSSSDFYGMLKKCHLYRLTYYGWRSGWLSKYPNLVTADDRGRAENCEF